LDWINVSSEFLSAFICVHRRLKGIVPAGTAGWVYWVVVGVVPGVADAA